MNTLPTTLLPIDAFDTDAADAEVSGLRTLIDHPLVASLLLVGGAALSVMLFAR